MATLIGDNLSMLLVVSCFGLPLGVADRTVEQVCREGGVQSASFLAVVNLLLRSEDSRYEPSLEGVDVNDILKYLTKSHSYYLDRKLPRIGEKLRLALGEDKISELIMRNFDEYVDGMREHIGSEESEVFEYIKRLQSADGRRPVAVSGEVETDHDYVGESLTELKHLIIRYYSGGDSLELVSVIHDLFAIAQDLALHTCVEDRLLAPLIRKIEEER
ncbi:MAG: hemerythrin domain-containing protein [Rikenellaceae bacterium]